LRRGRRIGFQFVSEVNPRRAVDRDADDERGRSLPQPPDDCLRFHAKNRTPALRSPPAASVPLIG
jgi:hypothetical protein